MAIWLTADLHLGHANILRHHAGRRWGDVRSMDRALIANVNACVGQNDELYVLGDFAHRVGADEVREYRSRIRCRNVYLVRGNHDKRFEGQDSPWAWERDYHELKCDAGKVVLFHYPIEHPCWDGARRGAAMLHGHIHSEGPAYNDAQREAGVRRYGVGVDANGYFPVRLDDVLARLADNWHDALP